MTKKYLVFLLAGLSGCVNPADHQVSPFQLPPSKAIQIVRKQSEIAKSEQSDYAKRVDSYKTRYILKKPKAKKRKH